MTVLVPVLPDNAPFTPEQRAWLNGFLAGVFNRAPAAAGQAAPAGDANALQPLTVLFGSQTGTAESLAKRAAKEAGRRGFAPTVLDMAATDASKLAAEKNVLVIVSTYGDGEPPDGAKALHTALGAEAPSLAGLRFSVCALGDTNYTLFCQCGKDFDARLEKHGASRVLPRADCDVDYEEPFSKWLDAALAAFGSAPAVSSEPSAEDDAVADAPAHNKANPFSARLISVRNLNGAGSAKQVNHVEFSLEGSGLTYEAGDALGVYPQNCPDLVNEVLAALGCDGEEAVATPAGELPLRVALQQTYDLGKPPAALLDALGLAAGPAIVDVLDALRTGTRAPSRTALEHVALLRKLQPRLYSISSSPKAHPGQVHLTVGAVRYELGGRARKGVCSTFLAERCTGGETTVPVFVHANTNFRLPADGDTPVIMVGPGTGIAPFRAFLEERRATGATGRNWLFFGDQREATDFLYRDELTALHADGLLTRLDLAWSRDQQAKVYVQQRMREHATELFAWLEAGAHVYVCGDASRMAKDVDAALHDAIATAGGKTPETAAAYVQALKAAKRYQRDVY
jgi:sulfite reductase (NADPH) flavoprotein alpha-component